MELDLNTLRSAVTLLSFIAFAGIVYWACDGKNLPRFNEAANLPFADDHELPESANGVGRVDHETKKARI